MKKTINHANKTILEVSEILNALKLPTLDLVNNANDLVVDIKKKSEGIDVLFKPLYSIKKTKLESKNGTEKISEVIECVAEGIRLFGKIKNEMK